MCPFTGGSQGNAGLRRHKAVAISRLTRGSSYSYSCRSTHPSATAFDSLQDSTPAPHCIQASSYLRESLFRASRAQFNQVQSKPPREHSNDKAASGSRPLLSLKVSRPAQRISRKWASLPAHYAQDLKPGRWTSVRVVAPREPLFSAFLSNWGIMRPLHSGTSIIEHCRLCSSD